MADIVISKFKLRRGTNDQRKVIIFDQGEPAYTTDTKRLYVGNGTLSGGSVVGAKVHGVYTNHYSLTALVAEIGDLAFTNNKYYQLTASDYTKLQSWADTNAALDSKFLSYSTNNLITLNTNSISASFFNTNSIGNGIKIQDGILQSNYDTNIFTISSSKLSLLSSSITEREIAKTSFGLGLSGGSGNKVMIDANPYYFSYAGNQLSLVKAPPFGFDSLSASWFGPGLSFNGAGQNISLENLGIAQNKEWPQITIDNYGRVTQVQSSIFDTLQGDSALSGYNYLNNLSSIFNGNSNVYTGTGVITKFSALSSDGRVITLSSAGFITFENQNITRTGKQMKRFAIPIFTY